MKRRDFIKTTGMTAAGMALMSGGFVRSKLKARPLADFVLSDPVSQPKFVNPVPDALAPDFIYSPDAQGIYNIKIGPVTHFTGLVDPGTQAPLPTPIWGYGDQDDNILTWPGRTFQIQSGLAGGTPETEVSWINALDEVTQHLLPVDPNLHWCYALHGYTQHTIANTGIPIITHLHGGHTDFQFDGNPEFFYTPNNQVVGPQWANVPGGFTTRFRYDNNVAAGSLWYHDHALGITRLNVYAGLAGFYFIRDQFDTGKPDNPLGLPAWPYEKAYAIQDRMFLATGELFFPAFPGDPFYHDFIVEEGAALPANLFPNGGPTALAEFFGDHMVVNGKIWPKEDVEPRNYRMRLLNGTDSRFLAIQFFEVPPGETNFRNAISGPLDFMVIGSDQGLASSPSTVQTLLIEPGSRYDVIFDFKTVTSGNRVIMKNIAGDEPFGGQITGEHEFAETDKIMAFDVVVPVSDVADTSPTGINFGPNVTETPTRLRKVALFEGKDEFGRLQPLLGVAEPATDYTGAPINWPDDPKYSSVGLVGQMEGAIAWHSPITENPALDSTEEWEVWNATGDAHPVHLHQVKFEVLGRKEIIWDSATNEEDRVLDPAGLTAPAPNGDGTYLETQPTVQHNSVAGDASTYGMGFRMANLTTGSDVNLTTSDGYVENTPKDMVIALPGQVARIKATFDKPGRYVWHCHILSHEDHEMMRVLHVGEQTVSSVADGEIAPDRFVLEQNYPNPFNPSTNIRFQLANNQHVEIKVYNIVGKEVRTLTNQQYAAGQHTLVWDGTNNAGRSVVSGVYIYKMTAGKFSQTRKMNLVR